MRFIGLDIGRDFAHVAVVEGSGSARRLPRIAMSDFRAFAATLGADDAVALEASSNTWTLVELLRQHAGSVIVSNPLRTQAIAAAKRKTDDIDAATLAELLAAESLPSVWQPDAATRRCGAWSPIGPDSSATGQRSATGSPRSWHGSSSDPR